MLRMHYRNGTDLGLSPGCSPQGPRGIVQTLKLTDVAKSPLGVGKKNDWQFPNPQNMILWDQWEMFRRFLILERKYGSWNCHTVIIFWHSPPFEELLRFILVRKIVCVRKDKLERKVGIWEDKSTGQKGGVTHLQHNALRWIEITEICDFLSIPSATELKPSSSVSSFTWTRLNYVRSGKKD